MFSDNELHKLLLTIPHTTENMAQIFTHTHTHTHIYIYIHNHNFRENESNYLLKNSEF